MLADVLPAADHCRTAHARQYARQAAAAAAAAPCARDDPCSPEFHVELSAACAPDYMGAAVRHGLHTRHTWCEHARTCHETALSHGVRSTSAPTRAALDMAGEVANTTCKNTGIRISASALVCRGLRQPSHGLHGRPRAPARHTHARWVADSRNPSAREHLWSATVRSAYTIPSSAVVHSFLSLRSPRLVGDHCLDFGDTALAAACSLCHDHVCPPCPDLGSAPRAQATREHRWRHIEHLLFECQCVPSLDSSVALPFSGLTSFGCVRVGPCGGGVASGVPDQSYRRYCCHGLCCPVPARPCSCPGPCVPWALQVAVLGSCRSVPAWCVVCGVNVNVNVNVNNLLFISI